MCLFLLYNKNSGRLMLAGSPEEKSNQKALDGKWNYYTIKNKDKAFAY